MKRMAVNDQPGEEFVFTFPDPRRIVARAGAVLFLFAATYLMVFLPLKVGFSRFSNGFSNHPALLMPYLLVVGAIAFFCRLAFPPPGTSAEIHFGQDYVRFIPSSVDRRILGEQSVEATFRTQAREVLICRYYLEQAPNGCAVLIRSDGGTEQELRVPPLRLLDAEQAQTLIRGASRATGLPVGFISQRRLANGTVQEMPWVPAARRERVVLLPAKLAFLAFPFLGGILVGYFARSPAIIVSVGLGLWLGQMITIYVFGRMYSPAPKFPILYSFTTLFTFSTAYILMVVLVGFILHR